MAEISTSAKRRAAGLAKPEERAQYVARPIRREVEISFPMPPATAKLVYGPSKGRRQTVAYRAWLNMAVMKARLGERRPGRIAGLCDVAIVIPEGRPAGDALIAACLAVAAEVGVIAAATPAFVCEPKVSLAPAAAEIRMVFTAIPVDPTDEAEILARTREGHPVSLIAGMLGVSEGQVQTVQAAALNRVHDIFRDAKAGRSPQDIAAEHGMPVEDVRAIIVRGRP